MATLVTRITELAGAVRDKFNQIMPRLLPPGGTAGQALVKASDADNSVMWSDAAGGSSYSLATDPAPSLAAPLDLKGQILRANLAATGIQTIKVIPPNNNTNVTLAFANRNAADTANVANISIYNSGGNGYIYLDGYQLSFRSGTGTAIYTFPRSNGTNGQYLTAIGNGNSAMTWTTPPASVGFYAGGLLAASEVIGRVHAASAFSAVAANCRVTAEVAATASAVITIRKAGTQIGTATFAAGATTATVSMTTTAIAKGDLITFHAPDTADATLADVSGTITN